MAMAWVIENGNTNLHLAIFRDAELVLGADLPREEGLTASAVRNLLLARKDYLPFEGGIFCPTQPWPELVQLLFDTPQLGTPLLLGHSHHLPLQVDYYPPAALGLDRVAACVGALRKVEPPFIVVSFGTAVTLTAVTVDHRIIGGAIFPGFHALARGLGEACPRLPVPEDPTFGQLPATNTHEAISDGIGWGLWFAVWGMIGRIERHLNFPLRVVATGGGLSVIPSIEKARFTLIEPRLEMLGLREIYSLK